MVRPLLCETDACVENRNWVCGGGQDFETCGLGGVLREGVGVVLMSKISSTFH